MSTESTTKIKGGLAADEFLERQAGSVHHLAVVLAELGSAAEMGRSEWAYDESSEAVELVRLCTELDRYLTDLSITSDGELTRWRECRRCGGEGQMRGENPCVECAGRGAIHADEADG